MPTYYRKNGGDILRQMIEKLQSQTPVTSIAPGSIARALAEVTSSEMSDIYDIMDYNMNQNLLSSATGSALDLLGSLHNVERKTVNNLAAVDKQMGAFYFYLEAPVMVDVVVPANTSVYTDATSFQGRRFSYLTTQAATITAGRTKAYTALRPNFTGAVSTAGPRTLVLHDFQEPPGITVFCTNPKEIAQQIGYETDDAYRVRIIKEIRVQSGGTQQAVRFAALSITGVREVKLRQNPYGMGSFEAIIIPEREGDTNQIFTAAVAAMEVARPMGVRMFAKQPTTVTLDASIELIIPGAGLTNFADTAARRAETGIRRYLNSLLPGNPFLYNRMIAIILDSSDSVKDVIIKSLGINGIEIMRKSYQPAEDEQIIPGNISVTIATA